MNTPEWNSYTANFFAPNTSYYNYPYGVGETQFSSAVVSLGTVVDWYPTTEEEGCSILDGSPVDVYSLLRLYELDPYQSDEHIMNLDFPSSAITLSCMQESCTSSPGSWVTSDSNSVVSAEFRVVLHDSCHYREGKGC